jgi:hypothetical protein
LLLPSSGQICGALKKVDIGMEEYILALRAVQMKGGIGVFRRAKLEGKIRYESLNVKTAKTVKGNDY